MYLSHFHLTEKPFKISTDPRFLWLGEKHKEALATLLYGILYNDGYVVVTGDVGTGKTTLASALMNALNDRVIAVKVPFPDFDSLDFFKLISTSYGLSPAFESKGSFFANFSSFLKDSLASGKKVVLIIDEAQRLTPDHLKELLHLSNLEENGTRLLNIVFVGQNEFNDILLEDANRALKQRMTINYNLSALTQEETRQYISHRLEVAQGQTDLFSPEAIAEIFRFSSGVPRLINIVCDLGLLLTYFERGKIVQPETIKESILRLRLPSEKAEVEGNQSDLPSRMEGMVAEAIQETAPEEPRGEMEKDNAKKSPWKKVAFAFGGVLLVVVVGYLFLWEKETNTPPPPVSGNAQRQSEQQSSASLKDEKSPTEKATPEPIPQAMKEPSSSPAPAKGPEAANRKQAPGIGEKSGAPKKAGVQSAKGAKPAVAGLKPTARPAPRPLPAPAKEERIPAEKEKNFEDESRSVQAKETDSERASEFAAQPSRESPREGREEIDPNKVIEWLIERRSGKD